MSKKKLYSNELLVSFEFSDIDRDYDFYHVTTSDRYIKGGAAFLDIDDIKVSALQFESGKSFWVMLPKNAVSRAGFVRLLNAKEDSDSLSVKSVKSNGIPDYLLTQLFLNALTSPVDEMVSFNNLSGKLLCFRPAWLEKDKDNFIWGMQCIEVKIGADMCIKMTAHRMTALALKKQMKFGKKYKRASLEAYKDIVAKEVINSGINIVDAVQSETSGDYLQDVADGINKIIPEAKCSVGRRLSKKKLNVRYIHDKSFYAETKEDPHQDDRKDYVVQHITVENFKHQSSAAVHNILKELVIKKDIASGQITLVDWSQYGYKADWLFGVAAEGNINLIKDTNIYSMPDYAAMGDVLKNAASKGIFQGKEVVTWLCAVRKITDKIKVQAELDTVIPCIDVDTEYTKAEVMALFKGLTTKKEVVRYVFENTGIMLYAYLRGEEERNKYLSGNIDINYIAQDESSARFSVGEIGNGMKYTIERASVVREIQAADGSKLVFRELLPLMGVEFVRYGMLTVVPFPFKYLREYIAK